MQITKRIIVLFTFLFITVSCSNDNIHEQIHEQLEKSIDIEAQFEENQQEILQLEEKDLQIYNEIIELNNENKTDLERLTNEAIELLEERMAFLYLEKESIEQSREQFEKIEQLISEVTIEEEQNKLIEMYDAMIRRYDSYNKVYDEYVYSINMTKQLYETLQEDADASGLYQIIQDVNESYENVFVANNDFNNETKKYNQLKQAYYETVWEK